MIDRRKRWGILQRPWQYGPYSLIEVRIIRHYWFKRNAQRYADLLNRKVPYVDHEVVDLGR